MMSLKRFRAMADSYGADLRRWPAERRTEAQALLDGSAQARAILDEARALDQAIEAAGRYEADRLGIAGEEDAALARLRAVVRARLAAPASPRRPAALGAWLQDAMVGQRSWFGMAAGGIAVIAGLMIGSMDLTPPAQDNLLSMLEPAPIAVLAE